VLRDKDEWRRPWADGAVGLPVSAAGAGAASAAGAGAASAAAASPSAANPGAASLGPAGFDADVAASPSPVGYLASDGLTVDPFSAAAAAAATAPTPSAAPVARSTPGAPGPVAPARGRRGGFLAGVAGGIVGAAMILGSLVALDLVELAPAVETSAGPVAPADGPAAGTAGTADPSPRPPLERDPFASVIPDMADRVLPTVVRINVSGTTNLTEANALGSGVIYRSDGYIITNHHVIEGASAVEVLLANGDRLEAEIVGSDPLNDLAVLRIAREGLPVIDLRPAGEPLRVGETVVAIGSPFGLDATVTSGIISALNRDLRVPGNADVIPAVIQTDAAINPGNSGGALVDLQGRLVGINTAIMSRSGANQGVGFAVSVRQAITSADQLIAQGFVRYPLLGITGTDVSAAVAEAFGLDNRRGAVVDSVQPGSGAAAGGMRTGDLIVAVDGVPLRSMSDLVAEVRRRIPGETVSFDIRRGAEQFRIDVVLGERPRS